MYSAFGVEHSYEVAKAIKIPRRVKVNVKYAKRKVRNRYIKDAPLKENEAWHGTHPDRAKKIKREGFANVNPRGHTGDQSQFVDLTTNKGRPMRWGRFGPGTYFSKEKTRAKIYGSKVFRVEHPPLKYVHTDDAYRRLAHSDFRGTEKFVAVARKQGYKGVYIKTSGEHEGVVGDARDVRIIRNRIRPTKHAYREGGAALGVTTTAGGAEVYRRKRRQAKPRGKR